MKINKKRPGLAHFKIKHSNWMKIFCKANQNNFNERSILGILSWISVTRWINCFANFWHLQQ